MIEDNFDKVEIDKEELENLIISYLDNLSLSESTKNAQSYALKVFYKYFISRKKFYFLPENIRNYKEYMENKLELKPVSIRSYLTSLRKFLNYLVQLKILNKNPAKRITFRIESKRHISQLLTPEQKVNLMDINFENKTYTEGRDMLIVALYVFTNFGIEEVINSDIKILYNRELGVKLSVIVLSFIKKYDIKDLLFYSHSRRTLGKRLSRRTFNDILSKQAKKIDENYLPKVFYNKKRSLL